MVTPVRPHYKRVAVYPSVLYGEDFIVESISSILPHVDHVFVVLMERPWGNTTGVEHKGEWTTWPATFDNTRERISAMCESRISTLVAQKSTPWNRWGYGVNSVVGRDVDFDEVIVLDPDCVFREDQAAHAFAEWDERKDIAWAAPRQIELWRTPAWAIVRHRQMVLFIRGDISLLNFPDPPGSGQVRHPPIKSLDAHVHNLGFAVSERTMRWKFLTARAFSPVVGESVPNPGWLDKWLTWHPASNNRDLEPSIGCESAIREAVNYDIDGLPACIRRRYDVGEWAQVESAWLSK